MRHLLAVSTVLALAVPASDADATQRVYEGREAAALRCANTLALTAVALARAELISQEEKDVTLGITMLIIERHVSGTWAEKRAALEVVRDRRSVPDTIEDYRRNAAKCLRQFPIN